MRARVVNLKHHVCDVRIDRKTRWGNPFHIDEYNTRKQVIELYRRWLWNRIQLEEISLEQLAELHGKTLGCHCAPLPCHGDVLAAAADWAYHILEDIKNYHRS